MMYKVSKPDKRNNFVAVNAKCIKDIRKLYIYLLYFKMRNKLCHCGSGKKYKRCCALKEDRKTVITFDFGKQIPITSIRSNPVTDEIEIFSFGQRVSPKNINVEYSYKKTKKPGDKVVTKQFGGEKAYLAKPVRALTDFDIIYSIDTNQKDCNGFKLCCSGIVRGMPISVIVPGRIGIRHTLKYCFSFCSTKEKPENQAWSILISRIPLWENVEEKSIGVIVDSDLGKLEEYNKRELPFYEDHLLPLNISLIYASGERDLDNPMNQMVKISDLGASALLGKFRESQKKEWEILCFDEIKIWKVEQKDPKSITFLST